MYVCVCRSEDLALARKIHMRNALEEAIYSIKSNLTERNDLIGISELDDFITWQVRTQHTHIHTWRAVAQPLRLCLFVFLSGVGGRLRHDRAAAEAGRQAARPLRHQGGPVLQDERHVDRPA